MANDDGVIGRAWRYCRQRCSNDSTYLTVGIAFLALGIAGNRTFLVLGMAFLAAGSVRRLRKQR